MPITLPSLFAGLEPWIRIYCYVLAAFFAAGLVVLLGGLVVALRRLAGAARPLQDLPGISPTQALSGATEQTYNELVSRVAALPNRGGAWWPAVRTIVVRYASPRPDGQRAIGYFVSESIQSVLQTIPGGDWGSGFIHTVPGALASLGLLGTFIALFLGLHGLQPASDGTYNLQGLISNLSGKFVTSIVALVLSVLFVLIELGARARINGARQRLADILSRVLPVLSTSHLLIDLQRGGEQQAAVLQSLQKIGEQQTAVLTALQKNGENQTVQLERFNTDLAVSIGSAMDARIVPALENLLRSTNELHKVQAGLGEDLLKEVGDKISGAVSGAAGQEMRSMGEAIKESVRSLNEAAQAMRDGQSKLVEVTSAIIGQMNESFGDNSKRLSEATERAVRSVVEQIDGAAGGFSARIGGASQEVAAALLTTSTNLQQVVEQCQQIISNTDATVQRFDRLVTSVSAATADTVTAHAALKATAAPLQEVAARTATLIGSVERQVNAMGQAAESLKMTSGNLRDVQDTLKSSWSEYERRFVDVDKSLGNSLDQLRGGFDLYAEKLQELNAGLDTHLSKALSDLSSVINELHESVEDLQTTMPGRAAPRQA